MRGTAYYVISLAAAVGACVRRGSPRRMLNGSHADYDALGGCFPGFLSGPEMIMEGSIFAALTRMPELG